MEQMADFATAHISQYTVNTIWGAAVATGLYINIVKGIL